MLPEFAKTLFFIGVLSALSVAYGSTPTHVLSGPSGLSSSLGDSLTAKGFDASSSYFNPATLMGQKTNLYLEYTKKNVDANNSWASYMAGSHQFKFGVTWNHMSLPLDSGRDQAYFSTAFRLDSIPYLGMMKQTNFGANLGLLKNKIADEDASAYFADLGINWEDQTPSLAYGFGASAKNLYFSGLKYRDNGESEDHPKEYSFGMFASKWNIIGLLNLESVEGNSQPTFGLQYSPIKFLDFRAGYKDVPRLGMGFNFRNMTLNYGYKLGEITSDQSLSFNYQWQPTKETDYTNPLSELEARHRSLEDYLVANLQKDMQALKVVSEKDVLKILIIQPQNSEAWNLFNSMTGEKKINVKIPRSTVMRRDYLNLAIAYSENDTSAKSLVDGFVKKYPNKKITSLVILIKKYDFKDSSGQ